MPYTYAFEKDWATLNSPIFLKDAVYLVRHGKSLMRSFEREGVSQSSYGSSATSAIFEKFFKSLYGAGFVVSDFDAPTFCSGPLKLIFVPGVSTLIGRSANLMTVRMYLHTMTRAYQAGDMGYGYSYFEWAYRSGGLRALVERVGQYCELAEHRNWEHLRDDPDLDLIRPAA